MSRLSQDEFSLLDIRRCIKPSQVVVTLKRSGLSYIKELATLSAIQLIVHNSRY